MALVLWLEPIGGISGDLFLGAMADLGLDLSGLDGLLRSVGLAGFALERRRVAEQGIFGTRVTVRLATPDGSGANHLHQQPRDRPTFQPPPSTSTGPGATAPSAEAHGPSPMAAQGVGQGHRHWSDIRPLLQRLPPPVAELALAIFGRLAEVEAEIHGVDIEAVAFHEVGALDSIVDIVGAAWAIAELGVERGSIFTRPPPLGSGLIESAHGTLPVPAPATLALLRGRPTLLEGIGETTTPTGAAILSACATFATPGQLLATRIGYGVGHRHFPDRPNLLRASLGEAELGENAGAVWVLEAHLDDASPQLLGHLLDRLLEAGALDAGLGPLTMKKSRPGQRLTVVCRADLRPVLSELIFRESTTLGVRAYPVERDELERRFVEVATPFGRLRVKQGWLGGALVNSAPEYDDCLAAARSHGVPLKAVLAAALAAL